MRRTENVTITAEDIEAFRRRFKSYYDSDDQHDLKMLDQAHQLCNLALDQLHNMNRYEKISP